MAVSANEAKPNFAVPTLSIKNDPDVKFWSNFRTKNVKKLAQNYRMRDYQTCNFLSGISELSGLSEFYSL